MDLDPIPELLLGPTNWIGKGQGLAWEYRHVIQFFLPEGIYPSVSKRTAIDLEVNRERQHQ